MKRVLFLCTGNYYRSRFAELLFNSIAQGRELGWQADSCGFLSGAAKRRADFSAHAAGLKGAGIAPGDGSLAAEGRGVRFSIRRT